MSGPSGQPLLGRTIGAELDRVAAAHGDRPAIVSRHQDARLTYGELRVLVERAARALLAAGAQKGDRVGIWSGNCLEWLVVQYATAKTGAILVNVNPSYRRQELAYALSQSGVSLLVSAVSFRRTDFVDMLQDVRPALPALREVVLLGAGGPGMRTWDDFLAKWAVLDGMALAVAPM